MLHQFKMFFVDTFVYLMAAIVAIALVILAAKELPDWKYRNAPPFCSSGVEYKQIGENIWEYTGKKC